MVVSDDERDTDEVTHIIPVGDVRAHELTIHCWCWPKPDDEEPLIMIHNSADGREQYEGGYRKPH